MRDVSRVPLAVHKECTVGTEWEQANQKGSCCDSLMGDNSSGQNQGGGHGRGRNVCVLDLLKAELTDLLMDQVWVVR